MGQETRLICSQPDVRRILVWSLRRAHCELKAQTAGLRNMPVDLSIAKAQIARVTPSSRLRIFSIRCLRLRIREPTARAAMRLPRSRDFNNVVNCAFCAYD